MENIITIHHVNYFNVSSIGWVGKVSNVASQEAKFNRKTIGELTLRSFEYLSCQKFTLPASHLKSRESDFSIVFKHWLTPLVQFLRGSYEEKPRIANPRKKGHSLWPDYIATLQNNMCSIMELKKDPHIKFYNKKLLEHRKVLHQIGLYMCGKKTTLGFLVTHYMLVAITFRPRQNSRTKQGTEDSCQNHSFGFEYLNFHMNPHASLLSGSLTMFWENAPEQLGEQGFERPQIRP